MMKLPAKCGMYEDVLLLANYNDKQFLCTSRSSSKPTIWCFSSSTLTIWMDALALEVLVHFFVVAAASKSCPLNEATTLRSTIAGRSTASSALFPYLSPARLKNDIESHLIKKGRAWLFQCSASNGEKRCQKCRRIRFRFSEV